MTQPLSKDNKLIKKSEKYATHPHILDFESVTKCDYTDQTNAHCMLVYVLVCVSWNNLDLSASDS